MSRSVVLALYQFAPLDDYRSIRQPLLELMLEHEIRGTILLASEGINGTVAGSQTAVDRLLEWLRQDPRLQSLSCKFSSADSPPFYRTCVKLKKEIVTMGIDSVDPNRTVGTYIPATEWNALISDPEVILVDTRNDYETAIGTFRNAIDPGVKSFRELPDYIQRELSPERHKKVAMFCTGGIRCEKSTAYLKDLGFDEVYHLEGGILKYLETIPESESLWQGECFVFDNRVSVDHRLQPGQYDLCHACRLPINAADKASEHYVPGVSCPHCFNTRTPEQQQRLQEREKQVRLARVRGEQHIGADAAVDAERHREQKRSYRRA
ncbi:MAG: rhodanese-related sulfurtransferase [Thiogranum sp.]|nr:rhodanese-related sulfurtransferase [Thiogranum sp.]